MLLEDYKQALEIVQKNAFHNLDIGLRHDLLKNLYGITDYDSASHEQIRSMIYSGVYAIEYGLLSIAENDVINRMVIQTLRQVRNDLSVPRKTDSFMLLADEIESKCDGIAYAKPGNTDIALGYACSRLLQECIAYNELYSSISKNTLDIDIQPSDNDTAFNVCVMISSGTPWDPNSDNSKRHGFWKIWLSKVFQHGHTLKLD